MQEMEQLLAASGADEDFKTDVLTYVSGGTARRIAVTGYIPQVKVKRLLKHVLATEPTLPIEALALKGFSGCSDFGGVVDLTAGGATHRYEFLWDCKWRAEQERWTDCFGFPDQIRAAREFDWRCFKIWTRKN